MTPAATLPEPACLGLNDLWAALAAGWADFRRAPAFGLFFAGVYVLGGWLVWWALTSSGQIWWTIPAALGFPLLGPFVAVGFYEVSRRLGTAQRLTWVGVLGVILRERHRQIPWIAAVIVIFFLFWNFVAHMIFALFMGLQVMTNVTTSLDAFWTSHGIAMLVAGTLTGAIFSGVLFALTVVALPLLLDREVDFVTAMLTSLTVVRANPLVMLVWAALIAALLFLGMLPGFLGLLLVLPLLGHSSWHLYRRALP